MCSGMKFFLHLGQVASLSQKKEARKLTPTDSFQAEEPSFIVFLSDMVVLVFKKNWFIIPQETFIFFNINK